MARQAGRAKSSKRAGGRRRVRNAKGSAKATITRKRRVQAARLSRPRPPADGLLVEAITHEIFQNRAAYRADQFAHERDQELPK
jgi:hypothetical protein